jgi:tetratricopeptide (TPR) repeat protein
MINGTVRRDEDLNNLRDSAQEQLKVLRREYKSLDEDDVDRATTMAQIGLIHAQRHETPLALRAFQQSLADARHTADTPSTARALESLGMLHAGIGEYPAALEYYFECIRLQEGTADPVITGSTWMEIGTIYAAMDEIDQALDCFNRSIEIFHGGGHVYLEVRALVNVAGALSQKGEFHEALDGMMKALIIFETLGEEQGVAESLLTIGSIHERLGGYEAAHDAYQRAADIADAIDDPWLTATAHLNMGGTYRAMGYGAKGLTVIELGLGIAIECDDLPLRCQLHKRAAEICEELGRINEAFAHQKAYIQLNEQQSRLNRGEVVAHLQVMFDIEQKERDRDMYRQQAQQLRQEVTDKSRELTCLALSLVQKSEFLDDLKRQLESILNSSHGRAETLARPLIEEIEASKGEESWQIFEQQFETVHHDYLKRLVERFPSLTPMELKICALTRVDLATKDIARLLYLSVRNIQNHRYRLRKKLLLAPDEHLETFLTTV